MKLNIAQQRLYNQRIEGSRCQTPEEVVSWLGAMQAQDYQESLWAIGLRTENGTIASVEQAIASGKILRTWPMRGTIHFVPAEDAKWMLQLTAQRILASDQRRQKQLELDEKIIAHAQELFYKALHGGKRLSRPEMMALLENAGISPKGQRGYHLIWYAAQTGLICFGPMENKQQTFVLLDEWAPNARKLSPDEALSELTRRYFTSHGPATAHDFARWTGLPLGAARTGIEGAKSFLISKKIEGQQYWLGIDAPGHQADQTDNIHLLPGFDEYLLGYKDRDAVLAAEHMLKIVPGNNGIFMPMMVSAGTIVGTWKYKSGKKDVGIVLKPFITGYGKLEEKMDMAAKRFCEFVGLPTGEIAVNQIA